jgi:hypothetical protein
MNINNREIEYTASLNAVSIALRATCQLLQIKKNKIELPVAHGCGILFEYNSCFYCISNAHVLAEKEPGETFVLLKDNLKMSLGGQCFYTRLPESKNRRDDPYDIYIIQLLSECVIALKATGYRFLTLEELKVGHKLIEHEMLMIAGFPAAKTKVDFKEKRLNRQPIIVRTIPFLKELRNFNATCHHIVQYPISKVKNIQTGAKQRVVKPHGISGSGLWLLNAEANGEYKPVLIGILSEYLENRALLISIKVDLFIDIIRQKFDPTIPGPTIRVDLQ